MKKKICFAAGLLAVLGWLWWRHKDQENRW